MHSKLSMFNMYSVEQAVFEVFSNAFIYLYKYYNDLSHYNDVASSNNESKVYGLLKNI